MEAEHGLKLAVLESCCHVPRLGSTSECYHNILKKHSTLHVVACMKSNRGVSRTLGVIGAAYGKEKGYKSLNTETGVVSSFDQTELIS